MIKDRESQKKFYAIIKSKENESYHDWKKWLISEVSSLDDEKLENMIKRYEFRLKYEKKEDTFGIGSLATQIVTLMVAFVPFMCSVSLTILTTVLNIGEEAIDPSNTQKYFLLTHDILQDVGDIFLELGSKNFIFISQKIA